MMKIKPAIGMIVLAFTSLIFITGSPFQIATNLVENTGHLNYKNIGQEAYAADDDATATVPDGATFIATAECYDNSPTHIP